MLGGRNEVCSEPGHTVHWWCRCALLKRPQALHNSRTLQGGRSGSGECKHAQSAAHAVSRPNWTLRLASHTNAAPDSSAIHSHTAASNELVPRDQRLENGLQVDQDACGRPERGLPGEGGPARSPRLALWAAVVLPISQRVGSLMSQPARRLMLRPWPSPPPSRRLKTGLFFPACLLQDPLMELPQNLNRLFAKAVKAER